MSNLLTHEEYSAIANSLSFPTNAFINGQFQSSKSGKTFETINPATGNVIAKVAACNVDDVCLLYTSPSPRDLSTSRMPSSA